MPKSKKVAPNFGYLIHSRMVKIVVLILFSRNCGQIMFLKKNSFHTRPIFDVKILEFWNFFSSKFLLIDSPLMTPATIFSHMKFWILKKNPDASNFWRSPKNFKIWVIWHALEEYFWNWYTNHFLEIDGFLQRLDLKYHPS